MEENIKTTSEWGQEERAVTLTNREWVKLKMYILMTTDYRKREQEAWKQLSEVKKKDGTPKYIHASGNVGFWNEMDEALETIRRAIEDSYR